VPPNPAVVQVDPTHVLVIANALGVHLAAVEVHVPDLVVGTGVRAVDAAVLLGAAQQLVVGDTLSPQVNLAHRVAPGAPGWFASGSGIIPQMQGKFNTVEHWF